MNTLARSAKTKNPNAARVRSRPPFLGIAATWPDRHRDAASAVSRWGKFNLVGAMGMVVQLAALWAFNWGWAGHYLVATTAALEVTLVHNFVWHLHYTWRDRRDRSALPAQLVRFHLSNGLVSAVGNLVLMRILVGQTHLPVIPANAIAILCCSIMNFWLGNEWVFAARAQTWKEESTQTA